MLIDKVLEMDAKTVEDRIRARHSGDQRMMDMLKVILIVPQIHNVFICCNLSSGCVQLL